MSLRIHFHSSEFPESVAKSIRRRLGRMGHDVPLGRMREATAAMYGYGKWNELLGRIGQYAPFLSDQEVGHEVAAERAAMFAERLSRALDLPMDVAAEVVAASGPTSRRSMGIASFDWDEAVLRMAGAISATARSIETQAVGHFEGFRVGSADPRRDWAILVDPAGNAIFSAARGSRSTTSKLQQAPEDGMFGRHLQEAGLLKAGAAGVPDPIVLRTLRRLDGRALGLLRAVPAFGTEVYAIARLVPEESPFEGLVDRLPMLGAEISHLAHAMTCADSTGREREEAARRQAMVLSSDPLAGYLDLVADFVDQAWPNLGFDRQRGRQVVEAIGNVVVLEDMGLLPWHVAFLSFAPAGKLPTSPSQMAASMLFIEKWTALFKPGFGVDPADFYREFDGDWTMLRSVVENMKEIDSLYDLGEVGETVTAALLGGRAVTDFGALPGRAAMTILERRLTPRLAAGRGMMGLLRPYARWYAIDRELGRSDVSADAYRDGAFIALSSSGLLPADLGSMTPRDLLQRLQIDPDAYAAALFDPTEFSASEVEIRITTASARDAVAASLGGIDLGREDLSGSTTFHRAVVGGVTFEAALTLDGPQLLTMLEPHRPASVPLGDCASIRTFATDEGPEVMYVIKYSSQRRIPLAGFGEAEIAQLRDEFGISERPTGRPDFYRSRAARCLIDYVGSHPRLAERAAGGTEYLGDWYGWALENASRAGYAPGFH